MRTEIVRIGNSRGIRIPKALIEQCGFGETVDLRVEDGRLILSPERAPRQGWEEVFLAAGDSENDEILLKELPSTEFDSQDWQW